MPRSSRSTNYFSDGKRLIDFVLVLPQTIHDREINVKYITNYIQYMQERGVKFEVHQRSPQDQIYVMVSLSKAALHHFANLYNIDITNSGHYFLPLTGKWQNSCKTFETPLTAEQKDMFIRRRGATSMERILVVNEVLNDAIFDYYTEDMYGLNKLIKLGVVKDAYPLHDGDCHYGTERDYDLNDRQLLLKYWANFSVWYKKQPLNLVEKYYGTEVAFYFAWLGFYNQMLIPASIVGLGCFISSILMLNGDLIEETCQSNVTICQLCTANTECAMSNLSSSCTYTKIHFLFDNSSTVVFSVFMSFWASLFLSLWKRTENILNIRWNVEYVEANTRIRLEYKNKATAVKTVPVTGDFESVIPTSKRFLYISVTSGICIILLLVVFLVVVGLMIYRIALTNLLKPFQYLAEDFIMVLCMVTAAIMQIIFIKLYGKFYGPLSIWLTKIENPRTQAEFDKSVIHKRFFLGFANNYVPLFYIAFLKGRLHFPDGEQVTFLGLQHDICHPSGCLLALCIQLSFLMFLKSLLGNLLTLIRPKVADLFNRKGKNYFNTTPQHEIEFDLESSDEYLLTTEFMEMIIQYGFVTFFVAAFPLAPLCALINNIMELRLDAYKFVRRHRRPIPRRQSGIGTWNEILRSITYLSTATNAFVLAFTSEYISRIAYQIEYGDLEGYVLSTLSVLEVIPINKHKHNKTRCHYRADRYPPEHEHAYALTDKYFYQLGLRFVCVLIFEHLIVVLRGMILYFVPDIPQSVMQKLHHEKHLDRELKIKRLTRNINKNFDLHHQSSKVSIKMTPRGKKQRRRVTV